MQQLHTCAIPTCCLRSLLQGFCVPAVLHSAHAIHKHPDSARAARSGAYNRTLTPFGFQAEERTLWQAPQTYITMSPFMQARSRCACNCESAGCAVPAWLMEGNVCVTRLCFILVAPCTAEKRCMAALS